jgi:GNAT superfamily N-acetyltransferase
MAVAIDVLHRVTLDFCGVQYGDYDTCVCYRIDDAPVGAVGLQKCDDDRFVGNHLAVAAGHTNRGVGTQLLRVASKLAREQGRRLVLLVVGRDEGAKKTCEFYVKRGLKLKDDLGWCYVFEE